MTIGIRKTSSGRFGWTKMKFLDLKKFWFEKKTSQSYFILLKKTIQVWLFQSTI